MSITYHVCKYTPTELLTALGGQCALLDEAPENFDLSDQVAHPNLCGFGKSVIQAALAGQVKELVLVNCCDTIRSAYDILKEFGNLDFLYLLDILHSQEGCSVQHARDQLLALAEAYGAYKGTQFDRAAFFAAFQSPPPVTGPHIAVLGAKMGSHLFSLVEETMPLPVENATCANNRRVAPPADQGDFAALMEDYARCLLGQLPCMRMTDNTARRALYNTPGLEGVVYHTLQFCDYYGFEYAGLRHQLPVPLLKIESDGTTQSREQLRTRLEAFAVELLHQTHLEALEVAALAFARGGDHRARAFGDRRRVTLVMPADDLLQQRGIEHGARHRADLVERRGHGDRAETRDTAVRRLDADRAGQRARLANRAAGVRAEGKRGLEGADSRGRTATRAAGHTLDVPRVACVLVCGMLGRRALRELVEVRLAEQRHVRGLELFDHGRVVGRDPAFKDARGGRRLDALRHDHVFDRDRHAGEFGQFGLLAVRQIVERVRLLQGGFA